MPKRGGRIIYLEYDRDAVSDRVATAREAFEPDGPAIHLRQLLNRGLADLNASGQVIPLLALNLPGQNNRQVSPDGLRVEWKLKPALRWSDGSPLTSLDVVHTWEVLRNSDAISASGFSDIASIATPDPQTAVLEYVALFPSYQLQFRNGLLAKHAGQTSFPGTAMSPLGAPCSGPFVVEEWREHEYVSLVRNPQFMDKTKPYLDAIRVEFRNDVERMRQMVLQAEAHISPWLTQPLPEELEELIASGLRVGTGSTMYFNRFQFNLRNPSAPSTSHPILGDERVRRAIVMGTNIRTVTANWSVPDAFEAQYLDARPEFDSGVNCSVSRLQYDPIRAGELLDEAGWSQRSTVGIRERKGRPLMLTITSYAGFRQEDNVAAWARELSSLGIESSVNLLPEPIFFGSWRESPVAQGHFDLLYYDRGRDMPGIDEEMRAFYHSSSIPEAHAPLGRNWNGVQDEDMDSHLEGASKLVDRNARREIYCEIASALSHEMVAEAWNGFIPNFQFSQPALKGWSDGERFTPFGNDVEDWYLDLH